MSKNKIRLFASLDCRSCLKLMTLLNRAKISFKYIDAFKDETQKLCDDNNVNDLPHMQILDEKNEVIAEHVGFLEAEQLVNYIDQFFPHS